MMRYKDYTGRVRFDDEAGLFHGEVVGTRDVVTFQGTSVAELRQAFHESVDDYLDFCRSRGHEPDRPYSGQFVVRLEPEVHRRVHQAATSQGQSLNQWVARTVDQAALRVLNPSSQADG